MTDNDIIVLNSVLEQKKSEMAPEYLDYELFELFSFEQILKNFDLSYDELEAGRCSNPDDGGIDGLFFFINEELVEEKISPEDYKRNVILDLFLIQAKTSNGFSETVFDRFNTTSQDLFDLTKDMNVFRNIYNSLIIDKVIIFREAYLNLASRHPKLRIHFIYSSQGNTSNINPPIKNRCSLLEDIIKQFFNDVGVEIKLIGARELLDLSRIEKTYTLPLKFTENFLSKSSDNYVILSRLVDYYDFVTDEQNNLRKYIFDANVRDFQGYVEVNKDIDDTLENEDTLDFWWLNNGITILASKASVSGKTITIDNVQIINGLQTTTCIFNYISRKKLTEEANEVMNQDRSILIKIIIVEDENSRDRIIKATNFQTNIPPASLKATERIHHNLEDFFKKHDWYYDRRKNYYKNLGKPRNRIISIPFMAQCIMTILIKEPHLARAKPSSLVKSDTVYPKLFNEKINPSFYLFCAQVIRKIEIELKKDIEDFTYQEKTNLKLHIGMVAIMKATGKMEYSIKDVEFLTIDNIDETLIFDSISTTIQLKREYMEEHDTSLERLAKSKDFVEFVKMYCFLELEEVIPQFH